MEIRNRTNSTGDRSRNDPAGDVIDLTKTNRQRIADAVQELETGRLEQLKRPPEAAKLAQAAEPEVRARVEDQLDVSVASLILSASEDPADAARRRAQIETVRTAVAEGSLATPERVERAVRKLLGN